MPASWERLLNKFCGWSEKQDARDAEAQALEAELEELKILPAPTASSSSSSLQPPQAAASTSSFSTLSPPQRTVDSIDEASRDFRLGHAKLSGMHELHFDDPATGKAVGLSICRTEADMQEVARALGVEGIDRRRRKLGLRRQWPDIEVMFLTEGGGCFNYDDPKAGRTSHTSQEKDFGLRFFGSLGTLIEPPCRPQPMSGGGIDHHDAKSVPQRAILNIGHDIKGYRLKYDWPLVPALGYKMKPKKDYSIVPTIAANLDLIILSQEGADGRADRRRRGADRRRRL